MNTFTLILIFTYLNAPTMTTQPGYTTLKSCRDAAQNYTTKVNPDNSNAYAYCIPGPPKA